MRHIHPSNSLSRTFLILLCLIFGLSGVLAQAETEAKPFQLSVPADVFDLSASALGQSPIFYNADSEDIIAGFFVRYGTGYSGITESNGLVSVGYDFGIYHNFAVGLEIMPSYFNVKDDTVPIKQTSIPFNVFFNAKGGVHLGGLIPFLKIIKFFAGAGGGIGSVYTNVTYAGDKLQKITIDPAVHLLGGLELDLGSVGLIVEYQKIKVLAKNQNPDPWVNYIVFGLRF